MCFQAWSGNTSLGQPHLFLFLFHMKLINFSSVFCSAGWCILSIGWWLKKDVLLVSSERITAVTLIFFKAAMTPSCVIRPGMWGNFFPSNFQFLIISNKNIIPCSTLQICKKHCRLSEKWCLLELSRNLRQNLKSSINFGHGSHVQACGTWDQN